MAEKKWPNALRWVCLGVSCLGGLAASSVWQNSFQNAMRAIFNMTETDANLMSTLGGVGATVSMPAGFVYEQFGAQMNAFLGGTMTGVAYFILWLAAGPTWRFFFAQNLWLIDFLYFLVGFGCSSMYMAILLPNAENFSHKARGKVIGILDASLSVGPTLLTVLYNGVFTNGFVQPGQEDKQNLAGYFLSLAILTVISNVAIFFFVGHIPQSRGRCRSSSDLLDEDGNPINIEQEMLSDEELVSPDHHGGPIKEKTPPSDYSEVPFVERSVTKVVFRWNFYFLLAQFILSGCLQITFQANISTFLRSFDMNQYNLLFTALNTAVQAVSKFGAGVVSDLIARDGRMPRAVVFLIPYLLQTIFLFLSAFYGDNFYMLLVTCVILGISTGVTWCQSPTLISELFGTKHLGSNWGLCGVCSAAFGFPFSIGFSSIYQAAIYQPGEIYCYGLGCFTWSFIMLGGASLASFIMALALTQNMFQNAAYRRRVNSSQN